MPEVRAMWRLYLSKTAPNAVSEECPSSLVRHVTDAYDRVSPLHLHAVSHVEFIYEE